MQHAFYKNNSMDNFFSYMLYRYLVNEPRSPFELLIDCMVADESLRENWNRDELAEHLIRKGASKAMLGTLLLAYDEYEEVKAKTVRAADNYLAQRERGRA